MVGNEQVTSGVPVDDPPVTALSVKEVFVTMDAIHAFAGIVTVPADPTTSIPTARPVVLDVEIVALAAVAVPLVMRTGVEPHATKVLLVPEYNAAGGFPACIQWSYQRDAAWTDPPVVFTQS
jgi:hypothetical protein